MAGSASTKKRRRIRSPHPGVVLIPPRGEHATWRARFKDPDTGRQTAVRLDPLETPTAERRRDWCVRRAGELARRKMDIAAGDQPVAVSPLADAVASYHREAGNRLRKSTGDLYKLATAGFLAWAGQRGITTTKGLKAAVLPTFRDYLLAQRKGAYVKGGKRGQRAVGAEKLSPQTVN